MLTPKPVKERAIKPTDPSSMSTLRIERYLACLWGQYSLGARERGVRVPVAMLSLNTPMLSLNAWGLGSEGAVRIYEVVPKSVEKLGVWAHLLVAPTRLRVIWP